MSAGFRRGLSPLLAVLIGLVIVVIAGVLIAQFFFSYAGIISHRPAAMIEYVDLVDSGASAILAINIKNTGNVPITGIRITGDGLNIERMNLNIPPGRVYGLTEVIANPIRGRSMVVTLLFNGGSAQTFLIAFGPLGPTIIEDSGGGVPEEGAEEWREGEFYPGVDVRGQQIWVGGSGSFTLYASSGGYAGWLRLSVACPEGLRCELNATRIYLREYGEAAVKLTIHGLNVGEYSLHVKMEDEGWGQVKEIPLSVVVSDFYLALDPSTIELMPGQASSCKLIITSAYYAGPLRASMTCPWQDSCSVNPDEIYLEWNGVLRAQITVNAPSSASPGEHYAEIDVSDPETGYSKSLELKILVQDFALYISEDELSGFIGTRASATIELRSLGGYSGCISLSYAANPPDGISDTLFDQNPVCLSSGETKSAQFSFKINLPVNTTITITGTNEATRISRSSTLTVTGMDFNTYFSPSSITIPVGGQDSSTLIVESSNYEGIIEFSIVECPSSLTCTISPSSTQLPKNGQAYANLTISAGSVSGVFTIKVGVRDSATRYSKYATLTVTVSEAVSDFRITLDRYRITVPGGQSRTVTVTITSIGGYSGTITLTVRDLPSDTTFSFSVNPVVVSPGGSASSILTIAVGSKAPPGDYDITIVGTDQNNISREVTLKLRIPGRPN